jgi:hypothetical protein
VKRRVFLFVSFGALALFFTWLIADFVVFLIESPANAVKHNNWLSIIVFVVYFAVGYLLVFLRAWGKTPPAEDTWPPIRCYGLLLWTLLTVLPSIPLCGYHAVRVHIVMCIVVDILFLVRMVIGRMRNEKGWIWQTYAVTYIWLEFFLPGLAVSFLL